MVEPTHVLSSRRASRRLTAAVLSVLAVALVACGDDASPDGEPHGAGASTPPSTTIDWSHDDRTYALLAARCAGRGPFTADTSDMLPVLVRRLADAPSDVLRHVKEQLAAAGEEAIEPLAAGFASWSEGRFDGAAITNGLGALRLSDAPGARELCMRYVVHPSADVRIAAAKALARHAGPGDYDLLMDLLHSIDPSQSSTREAFLIALATADPGRLQRDLAEWIRQGAHRGLWIHGLALALDHVDARTAGRFADLSLPDHGPVPRVQLLALQASAGDAERLFELRGLLTAGGVAERSAALLTLGAIGREEWAAAVMTSDTLPSERSHAAATLGPVADRPEARDALRLGLNDADRGVRLASLTALLGVGDAVAIDRALALYRGALGDVELASLALANAWDRTPDLADRARRVLLERIEADAADFARVKPLYQALGLIPGRASAEALLERWATTNAEEVQGLDAHRWFARAASNTGPEGRAYLAERWRTATDPRRRMDYLEAAGGATDETSRAFLLEVVESERASEIERLLAAEWLARRGPAGEVAPILKRAALRMDGERTRPAMNCVLWTWYG